MICMWPAVLQGSNSFLIPAQNRGTQGSWLKLIQAFLLSAGYSCILFRRVLKCLKDLIMYIDNPYKLYSRVFIDFCAGQLLGISIKCFYKKNYNIVKKKNSL